MYPYTHGARVVLCGNNASDRLFTICTVFFMVIGNLGCVAPHTKILGVGQPEVDFCSIMHIIMRVHAILTVYVWVHARGVS